MRASRTIGCLCGGSSAIRISSGNSRFSLPAVEKLPQTVSTDSVSWESNSRTSLSGQTRRDTMVCGGYICTKNSLCALNILYVVSRSLLQCLLFYGLPENLCNRWRRFFKGIKRKCVCFLFFSSSATQKRVLIRAGSVIEWFKCLFPVAQFPCCGNVSSRCCRWWIIRPGWLIALKMLSVINLPSYETP